jgi:hypothetical protein
MTYFVNADETACCGVKEIGGFDSDPWGSGDYSGETFQELLADLRTNNKGIVYHIWFVKYKNHDGTLPRTYQWAGLRALVRKIPGVVHIATTINPNSGNKIDGYSWVNK